MQYNDLNEIVNVVVILTSGHINVSTFFLQLVTFLSAKVSPEESLNPGYGNLKECLNLTLIEFRKFQM